jgi:hypothetical protein
MAGFQLTLYGRIWVTPEALRVCLQPISQFPCSLRMKNSLRRIHHLNPLTYDRNVGLETCFAESHAAAVKHNVVTTEKTMGIIKKYFQLKTVMAAKQRAKAHAVPRISAKDSGGRPPSCHADTAARSRNTLTKSPNPT